MLCCLCTGPSPSPLEKKQRPGTRPEWKEVTTLEDSRAFTLQIARRFVEAISKTGIRDLKPKSWDEYR